MIDTIFLDLDNTILDFSMAERIALSKTLRELGIEPAEAVLKRYSEINQAQWRLLEQGKLTRARVLTRRFELLFAELGVDASPDQAAKRYETLLGIGHYFIDGAEEVLESLSANFRLYILTNGSARVQKERLASARLDRFVQDVFISEEVGFDKPRLEYFEACFRCIPDFQKDRSVMIGDSLTSDIQGGRNAGIRTVWFNPSGGSRDADVAPDYEIRKLWEIEELVREL